MIKPELIIALNHLAHSAVSSDIANAGSKSTGWGAMDIVLCIINIICIGLNTWCLWYMITHD